MTTQKAARFWDSTQRFLSPQSRGGSVRFVLLAGAYLMSALCSTAAAAAGVDWSTAQQLIVVTKNYKFDPKHLKLKSGTPYRLHIENKGSETHEFNAAKLFRNSEIGDASALNADHTEVVVQPGGQKDLLLMPKKAGKYKLVCPDHDWAGMTGDITVE